MELKGGDPKCCKTQGFESKLAFCHSPMSILGKALRSAHFFCFVVILCTVVQSHAIHCLHFVGTYRHRHKFSSEDSLLSRCFLKKHCVLRNLSSLATGDQSFVCPGAWIDLLQVSCLFSQTAFWHDSTCVQVQRNVIIPPPHPPQTSCVAFNMCTSPKERYHPPTPPTPDKLRSIQHVYKSKGTLSSPHPTHPRQVA